MPETHPIFNTRYPPLLQNTRARLVSPREKNDRLRARRRRAPAVLAHAATALTQRWLAQRRRRIVQRCLARRPPGRATVTVGSWKHRGACATVTGPREHSPRVCARGAALAACWLWVGSAWRVRVRHAYRCRCVECLSTPLVMRGGRGAHRTHGTACWVWGSPPLRYPVFARSSHRPANAATLTRKHAAAHGSGSRQPVSAGRTRFARGGQAGKPHRGRSAATPDAWAEPARWAAGWRRLRTSDAAARSAAGPGRVTAP